MKALLHTLFALFLAVTPALSQKDVKAEQILNELSKKYKNFKTIKADFRYILEMKSDDFKEEQTGTIYLKNDMFKLSFGDQMIMSDNVNMWTYLKDVNEVQVDKYRPDDMEIKPNELFMIYDKDFLYRFVEEKKEGDRTLQVIELTPNNKEESYFKIKISIDKNKKELVRTVIYEKSGNLYTYEITSFTPNVSLDESFFRFETQKHPGVTVVDLR
ncbi:MAG: outer membrane lipoprotein carrier protein LolA [Bacteroidia bacterium]